jgi:oxaloacetate decarboxylase beta subunit
MNLYDAFLKLLKNTGFYNFEIQSYIMIFIGLILLYLAIKKKFEPLLLVPIGFGAILVNIPGNDILKEPVYVDGILKEAGGLFYYFYAGIKHELFPPLIFLGVGACTDFSPLIANPKTFLLGAAAQIGIFITVIGSTLMGFSLQEAASIGIIGGADGPTAIFTTSKLAPHLLSAIAVSAYSYMALVPIIQPPIMKLLTSKDERKIKMPLLREVSQKERIFFPIISTIICSLLIPAAVPLIGMLMFGNLLKESKVTDRLFKTAQDSLMNIIVIFLGLAVGSKMVAKEFLRVDTIKILLLGVIAFCIATASGVIFAKIMNYFSKEKINPLIGAAGVSAVPMAARVVQVVGQEEDKSNFLLMHAMGPNVAGVIGSAIAAGVLITLLS